MVASALVVVSDDLAREVGQTFFLGPSFAASSSSLLEGRPSARRGSADQEDAPLPPAAPGIEG